MEIKHYRLFGRAITVAASILVMILVSKANDQPLSPQSRIRYSADEHVERGLFLFKPHIIGGLPESLSSDLRRYSAKEERLIASIEEFQKAIGKRRQLRTYKVAQVYAYLGDAWRGIGIELRKERKNTSKGSASHFSAQKAFQNSLKSFRLALENDPSDLKYTLTEAYIETFVYLGKLDKAISVIQKCEQRNLVPDQGRDHGLIRLKADIQLMKGQLERAALTYEQWISKGNVHSKIVRGSDFYKKLENLYKTTGHPANLSLVN